MFDPSPYIVPGRHPFYGLLTGERLRRYLEDGLVEGFDPTNINPTELDIRLGNYYWREKVQPSCTRCFELTTTTEAHLFDKVEVPSTGLCLKSKQFIKAETLESFSLPSDVTGLLTLRSFAAQRGLEQMTSVILKPGWSGKLVLELCNMLQWNEPILYSGDTIAQVHFFAHEAAV